mmetsp:Transcript_56938/g.157605  ORF Transcript_56938/g.157605 Transcript_56938/m.157605 type:complete len:141 (+) Transcript_56938:84-506(+)
MVNDAHVYSVGSYTHVADLHHDQQCLHTDLTQGTRDLALPSSTIQVQANERVVVDVALAEEAMVKHQWTSVKWYWYLSYKRERQWSTESSTFFSITDRNSSSVFKEDSRPAGPKGSPSRSQTSSSAFSGRPRGWQKHLIK